MFSKKVFSTILPNVQAIEKIIAERQLKIDIETKVRNLFFSIQYNNQEVNEIIEDIKKFNYNIKITLNGKVVINNDTSYRYKKSMDIITKKYK